MYKPECQGKSEIEPSESMVWSHGQSTPHPQKRTREDHLLMGRLLWKVYSGKKGFRIVSQLTGGLSVVQSARPFCSFWNP